MRGIRRIRSDRAGGNNRGHLTAGGERAVAKAVVPALRTIL
jgi:hypothetical protein